MELTPLRFSRTREGPPYATLGVIAVMAVVTGLAGAHPGPWADALRFDPLHPRAWQALTSLVYLPRFVWLLASAAYLWVFGAFVEDRLGPWRFLLFLVLGHVIGLAAYGLAGGRQQVFGLESALALLMALVLFTAPCAELEVFWAVPRARRPQWRMRVWVFVALWIAMLTRDVLLVLQVGGNPGPGLLAFSAPFVAGRVAVFLMRIPGVRGTGWYLPAAPDGGAEHADRWNDMVAREAMWKAIDEHYRRTGGPPRHAAPPQQPGAPQGPAGA